MTDTMFTRTALTEAAETAGVTADQARTILEAAGVKVQPESLDLPTKPGSVIIATEVRGVKGEWVMVQDEEGVWYSAEPISGSHWHRPTRITVWTEVVVSPAGTLVDLDDVREGDRVRVVLLDGGEATFTVITTTASFLYTSTNSYAKDHITAVMRLLHREEA